MKPKQALIRLFMVTLLCLLLPATGLSETSAQAGPSGELFLPSDNAMADVEQAMHSALANNRLVLVVMGANWCHDSTGFVEKMQDPTVRPLLEDRYQVQLINVGYLTFIRKIVTAYDVPVIYGTPTVLVIDPKSNTVLNRDTLPYWRNADNISIAETRAYFRAFSPHQALPTPDTVSAPLKKALAQIDQFEQSQAERIYSAYAVLGPMLKAEETGQPPAGFVDKWKELATMRSGITKDLRALRLSAAEQAAAGASEIQLDYPHYPLFID
jgi:hypothetical protein